MKKKERLSSNIIGSLTLAEPIILKQDAVSQQ